MYRNYLPESCDHPLRTGTTCSKCAEQAIDNVFEEIITEVSRFDSTVIINGREETEEDKLINKYADGVVQGYKDAVKQIVSFLKDLRHAGKEM